MQDKDAQALANEKTRLTEVLVLNSPDLSDLEKTAWMIIKCRGSLVDLNQLATILGVDLFTVRKALRKLVTENLLIQDMQEDHEKKVTVKYSINSIDAEDCAKEYFYNSTEEKENSTLSKPRWKRGVLLDLRHLRLLEEEITLVISEDRNIKGIKDKKTFFAREAGGGVKLQRRTPAQKEEFEKLVPGNTKQEKPETQKNDKVFTPLYVQSIIDFWNSLNLPKVWARNTKTYKRTVRYIRQIIKSTPPFCVHPNFENYNRTFTEEEIKLAIKRLADSIQNPMYDPINGTNYWHYLSKVKLDVFIFNPVSSTRKHQSLFLHFIENEPELAKLSGEKFAEDEYPSVTKVFKRFYRLKVLGGLKVPRRLDEEIRFRMAAKRTVEFYREHKKKMRLKILGLDSEEKFAELVCEAVYKSMDKQLDKLTPGAFCSDYTFNHRLPSYLSEQAVVEENWL